MGGTTLKKISFSILLFTTCLTTSSSAFQVYSATGFTGYLTTSVNGGNPVTGYQSGFSMYSSVYTLNPGHSTFTQLGWGTWYAPENRSFTLPLCPIGTYARDNWPERAPTYSDVYQTIEGGLGEWETTHFPSSIPKFRVNGVPDCYSNQLGSPGWQFGGEVLSENKLGLAQLSNRLLIPPDGVTFTDVSVSTLLGYGWIALPLIQAGTSLLGVPTGDQSMTLFFNAANFKGPVAFFTPEIWSAVNAIDPTGIGRGHDARPGHAGGLAIEFGNAPIFLSQDNFGVQYAKIPRLTFAADANGKAVLLEDIRFYSKQAIWDSVANWLENGVVATQFNSSGIFIPSIQGAGNLLSINRLPISFGSSLLGGAIETNAGSQAFGIQWSGSLEPGALPEYYKKISNSWLAITPAEVPVSTGLVNQTFPKAEQSTIQPLDFSASSPWTSTKWSAGPFTATLTDSSVVEYVWYKFIDQPAITRLNLSQENLQKLQAFVESLHEHSGVNGITIPPPTSGTLVNIDGALIVTPPAGMEKGYVPIVINQYKPATVSAAEMAALESIYNETNGANWTHSDNWFTGPINTWYGITVQDNHVTGISLYSNNLTGTFPAAFTSFPKLKFLEVSQNHMSGTLPTEFGSLTELTSFGIFNNNLTGELPPEMGNLVNLGLLQLGQNQFTGAIPQEFGQLTNLSHLLLSNNQFTGSLPLSLKNLTSLTTLEFIGTQLCVPQDSAFFAWFAGLSSVTSSGLECAPISSVENGAMPYELTLSQNYPNPFNPQTTIEYTLPQRAVVRLTIYDALGKEVRALVNTLEDAGIRRVVWDGQDGSGNKVASGPYYYRLIVNGNAVETKKLILLK